jgi:hypothetical protein
VNNRPEIILGRQVPHLSNLNVSRIVYLFCLLALSIVVMLGYWSAPQNSFHFDDSTNIQNVSAIHMSDFSLQNLGKAAQQAHISARPIPNITFAIDWWRGGGEPRPFIWTNILLHGLAAFACFTLLVLVFRHVGYALYPSMVAAFTGAVLWAAHPIQVQAVTYVVQRMTSMAALFVMLSMIGYLKARTSRRYRAMWWALCLSAVMAGALSKENAWMAPILLLLLEFAVVRHGTHFFRNKRVDLFLLGLPLVFGVVVLIDMVTGLGPTADYLAGYEHRNFTLWERLLTQPRVIAFHLSQIMWPSPDRFSIAHDVIVSSSLLTPPTTLLAIIAVIVWFGIGVFLMTISRYRLLGFFALFFPIALIPESSIIPLEMVFEHRMYLPSIALAGLLGYLCLKLIERAKPKYIAAGVISVCVIAVSLTFVTQVVVTKWKDGYTLWSHALRNAPLHPRVHENLSLALRERGQIDDALLHARRSVQLDPLYPSGVLNLARTLQLTGDRSEAHTMYVRVLKLLPDYAPAHYSLGMLYLEVGDHVRANHQFAQTLKYDPYHSQARLFLDYTEKAKSPNNNNHP